MDKAKRKVVSKQGALGPSTVEVSKPQKGSIEQKLVRLEKRLDGYEDKLRQLDLKEGDADNEIGEGDE